MNQETKNDEPKIDVSAKGSWLRLPEETPDAYTAFTVYLDLGFDATLADVAAQIGRTPKAVRNFSSRFQWRDRAAAWRQHNAIAALSANAIEKAQDQKLWNVRLRTTRECRWDRLAKLDMLCDQALNKLVSDPQASVAPYELASFLRLSSDCAEQVTAHAVAAEHEDQNTGPDPIVLEFRAHIEKACEDKLKRDALSQPPQAPPAPAPETTPATDPAPPPPPEAAPSPRGERVG